jgi:Mrp family chromosome partitioning ATPase
MSLGALTGAGVGELLDPGSPVRRHYEDLANNLLSLGEVRSVVVTSPEPGAGCTSVCVGLGAALAGMGKRSAVVDCNLEDPGLHRIVGGPNFTGLTSGLDSEKALQRYGYETVPGLLIVPTGPVLPGLPARIETGKFVEVVRSLEEGRDLVILDAPVAGSVLGSPNLSGGFDGVLLVVHASRTPKSVARETTDDLLDAGVNLLGVVLNGCS